MKYPLPASAVPLLGLLLAGNLTLTGTDPAPLQIYESIGSWGTPGHGPGQFATGAYGLALEPLGTILVGDQGNCRVQRFDPNGTCLGQFGGSGVGNGQLSYPQGVAIDGLGRVYVADVSNRRVQRFRWDAELSQYVYDLTVCSDPLAPLGVAVDSSGQTVYVSDFTASRILKLTWDGSLYVLRAMLGRNSGDGSSGSGPGELFGPAQVSLTPTGFLYVGDSLNQRIQKWGPDDTYRCSYGSAGSGPGQFSRPQMAVEDAEGNLFVSDTGNHRVQKLDADGNVLAILGRNGGDGTAGNGAGQFREPFGLALSSDGTLYVSEVGNLRVQKFRRAPPPVRTVTFLVGDGGALEGSTTQTVGLGAATMPVTAKPGPGHHFVRWTLDGHLFSTDNPIRIASVSVDLTLTAEFALNRYDLTYAAGANGSIVGPAAQTVDYGASGSPVTAAPAYGFVFARWSDGSPLNPRTDTQVSASLEVTAAFETAAPVAPQGRFVALLQAGGVTGGRGLWDLTGSYATRVGGQPLVLDILHDAGGRISGTAVLQLATGKGLVPVALAVRGSAKGSGGALQVRLEMSGAAAANAARAVLGFNLFLDQASRQLRGPVRGSLGSGASSTPVDETAALAIPSAMDGTWQLRLDLAQGTREVTGSVTLTLANGVEHLYVLRCRPAGPAVRGSLTADPAAGSTQSPRVTATLTALAGGWARLEALSGKGYGQSLLW